MIIVDTSGRPNRKSISRRSNTDAILDVIVDDSTDYRKLSAKKMKKLLGLVAGGQIPRFLFFWIITLSFKIIF